MKTLNQTSFRTRNERVILCNHKQKAFTFGNLIEAVYGVCGNLPVPIDTGQAAKTLMDYMFIAPASTDKDGAIKTTTLPLKNCPLDKMTDSVE